VNLHHWNYVRINLKYRWEMRSMKEENDQHLHLL
jgi:hypothetical protein